MAHMSRACEIATNVWLGPTPDSMLCPDSEDVDEDAFDVIIETTDLAQAPDTHSLKRIGEMSASAPQHLEFPASGSITPETNSNPCSDPLTRMCHWIHKLANPTTTPDASEDEEDQDSDGDIRMKLLFPNARKILIHCTDGYTETTLLGLAYFMYAEQIPLHEALLRLHCEKNRNFFAYPSDIPLLASLQSSLVPRLSSRRRGRTAADRDEPAWLSRIDGSLPSRILPYMYLGNLGHANNPELLKAMGIKQILSVGEPVHWSKAQMDAWGQKNMLVINDVQDNGVDPLMKDFDRCLGFIGKPIPTGLSPSFLCSKPTHASHTNIFSPQHRPRQKSLNSNPSPLPRRRLPLCHHLHRRSHVIPPPLLSPCLLLRPCSPAERHYSAASEVRV